MKKISACLLTGVIVLSGLLVAPLVGAVGADDMFDAVCTGNSTSAACRGSSDTVSPFVGNLINILLWAVGIVAVIMLIWGGIRYITSGGDSNKLTAAKNTIMYAVIGVAVAALSYAIVVWVNSQATTL